MSEPNGVAIPYPFESKLLPTFIVSHGARSFKYSFTTDSNRNAYFPWDSRTFLTPCF